MSSSSARKQNISGATARKRSAYIIDAVQILWGLQFITGALVMFHGMFVNDGGRKYVPIEPSRIPEGYMTGSSCEKAYVNVYASNLDEEHALLYCSDDDMNNLRLWLPGDYDTHICSTSNLLFANSLTGFPQAWLLPMIPFLLQLLVALLNKTSLELILRRGLFKFVLMNIRGCILYLGFDFLQKAWHANRHGETTNLVETDCWYQDFLRPHQRDRVCYGQRFDFSDHVVLFYAQILPVLMLELLVWIKQPPVSSASASSQRLNNSPDKVGLEMSIFQRYLVPALIVGSVVYLHMITYLNIHKTAAYYHTGPEMMVGYAISLCVQLPIGYLVCHRDWGAMRQYVGLSAITANNKQIS
eukprot:CAMPEP_0198292826 /NCGR_PEP_ID=MMETSP1449-20131203/14182_1 /TAXON_ID=420275 /ORGANISM="Attheya septentrionalis, Strain CCMP2084" /LENGTH=356 /DNA_ID=CAMNT_0043992139 /DNA_START=101 /DNA_END=1174 /DNA_ORIENTATION=+